MENPKEEPIPVWKQIIETCGGEEEFMKSVGLLPNQKTLEETANKQWGNVHRTGVLGFIDGAKWQQERMYSEEEVIKLLQIFAPHIRYHYKELADRWTDVVSEWFEQFKKK